MEVPRHWRLQKQRYGLLGEVCPKCDTKIFPKRIFCPNCDDHGGIELNPENIANSGVVFNSKNEVNLTKTSIQDIPMQAVPIQG